ncbi:MAG: Gfo/Idh/MocA family oxidoreductase [Candidatus Omnitrophota bacterium]
MFNKKIRFGVLGFADIAKRKVIPALLKSKSACLSGIATRGEDKAKEIEDTYKVKSYSYEALLDSNEIDAVYIPLPNNLHFEWSLKALEKGKHVLCEKPAVLDVESALVLAQAAEKHERCLMEGYMFLYHPQHRKVKEIIDAGDIGEPKLFRSSFGFVLNDPGNFRFKKGGGALLDLGGYSLSIIRLLFKAEPKEASGFACYNKEEVDVDFSAVVKLSNSINADVSCSFNRAYECFYQVIGTDGIISLDRSYTTPDNLDNIIHLKTAHGVEQVSVSRSDHFLDMIEYFCDNINSAEIRHSLITQMKSQAKAVEIVRAGLKACGPKI